MRELKVKKISRNECKELILNVHYAKRWPSISYAFGLFDNGELIGVVTFGTPASSPLRSGIAGKEYSGLIIELNRLCLKMNRKNEASYLVSNAIKMLPKPKIIISFADTDVNHKGYVYQACNFTYHGLSAKRTDWKVKGMEHKHGQTIADEFRGHKKRANLMREKYGDDFYLSPRPRKHRYIYIHSCKTFRKTLFKSIRYQQEEYPK